MTRLLISTALVGLLSASAALAQDRHDDRGGSHPAPHPEAIRGPAAHAPAMQAPAMRAPGHRDNRMAGPRPAAGMANPGATRDSHRTAGPRGAMGGPAMAGPGHAPSRGNFSAYRRAFNAPHHYHAPDYRRPSGWYAHRWTFGEFLPRPFWVRDYWLTDFRAFGLMPPPPGTVWVRYGGDALLIDEYSGEVIQVAYGVFY